MKKIVSALLCFIVAVTVMTVTAYAEEPKIKVACIGDSITDGSDNFCEYPANLQKFLDADKYEVKNFGFGGTTAMKNPYTVPSYWNKVQFTDSKNYQPDIVIIMLGTNDVVNEYWDLEDYTNDLTELVEVYQNLASKPTVYLCTPPTAFDTSHPPLLAAYAVPTVKAIAAETGATLVDINALTAGMKAYFPDNIHPNNEGYVKLAQIFYEQIFDGEVHELTVKADPGSKIVFAGQQKTVDTKGEVKLVTGNGKKSIKIEKAGYGFTYVDVTVKGDTYADCTGAPLLENIAFSATATDKAGVVTKTNDGNGSTNWQRDANEDYANVWLQYDFGEVKEISGMELEWRDTERASQGQYKFTYSTNGTTWKNLTGAEFIYTDSVDTVSFDTIEARYIKFSASAGNGGKARPCLYEWRVFNKGDEEFTPVVSYSSFEITAQPEDALARIGDKATVTVSAIGEGLTYEWYYAEAGSNIFKKTETFKGDTYSVTMSEARSGRRVYCVITDVNGETLTTETAALNMKVSITDQPEDVVVGVGEKAKVTVTAKGNGLTYAWYYAEAGSNKFKKTETFKGNTYSVTMNDTRSGRRVYCEITDQYGETIYTDIVTLGMSASVTAQPEDSFTQYGDIAEVTVKAAGDGLTYAWYYKNPAMKNFVKSSVADSTYFFTMKDSKNGRQVYCVITDKYGNSVTTDTVTLRMSATITTQPKDVSVNIREKAKVSVKAKGDGLTYQWFVKDKGASEFTKSSVKKASYSYTMTTAKSGRQVYCVITDKYGNEVRSETVTLNKK